MKEAERVARTYSQFFITFVLLMSQLIGWRHEFDKDNLAKFRKLGKKVGRINRRYVDNVHNS